MKHLLLPALLAASAAGMTSCSRSTTYPVYYEDGGTRAMRTTSSAATYYNAGAYYSPPSTYGTSSGHEYVPPYTGKPAGVGGTVYDNDAPEGFNAVKPPHSYSY